MAGLGTKLAIKSDQPNPAPDEQNDSQRPGRFSRLAGGVRSAQVRTSANYSITTEVADSGGASATSAAYSNVGSSGGVTGISTVASPAEVAKQGYIGQLYEVVGFTVSAPQSFVNEGTTLQLSGGTIARRCHDARGERVAGQLERDQRTAGIDHGQRAWPPPKSSIRTPARWCRGVFRGTRVSSR